MWRGFQRQQKIRLRLGMGTSCIFFLWKSNLTTWRHAGEAAVTAGEIRSPSRCSRYLRSSGARDN